MELPTRWKRLPTILLLSVLAIFALVACSTADMATEVEEQIEDTAPAVREAGEGLGNETFSLIDANANGVLEEREFNLLLAQADIDYEGQFGRFDTDANQRLTQAEFGDFLDELGVAATENVEDALGAIDSAGQTEESGS